MAPGTPGDGAHSVLVSDKVSDRERRTGATVEPFCETQFGETAVRSERGERARELCEFPAISIRILKTRGTELKIVRCIGKLMRLFINYLQ